MSGSAMVAPDLQAGPGASALAAPAPAEGPDAWLARADAARKAGRVHEAEGICLDLLAAGHDLPAVHALRGAIAFQRSDLEAAVALLERAVADAPRPAWLGLLCNLYRRLYRLDDALRVALQAVARAENRLDPLLELARVHMDRDQLEAATDCFLAALAIDPEHPGAHMGLGQILLAQGCFGPGWIEYGWRNRLPEAKGRIPTIKGSPWNGMELPRGRLLVVCDQGFGDAIQFARYLPLAAARVREVVVACGPELEALFAPIEGVSRIFHRWADAPGFTAFALVSSLPGIFGTDAATIPAAIPYLAAPEARIRNWAERLPRDPGGRRRIGVFWSGRPTHPNNARRSLALAQLAPLLGSIASRAEPVSIQKDRTEADRAALSAAGILDLADDLADFGETAAVLSRLDLLITVDSAVAHLAGALGVPVWVMLPSPADWRWQRARDDSPWYPTMRLFRQAAPGDWPSVLAQLGAPLDALLGGETPSPGGCSEP